MNPNPIFSRENTIIIDEGWEFSFDRKAWQAIYVPFCPQSKLSGIGHKDFIKECYYRHVLKTPVTDKRVMLHFGAVDYRAVLYVNGKYVGSHIGGYTPFEFDITDYLNAEDNELLLFVYDEDVPSRPSGKQSRRQQSYGCFYTRTTGIWQSVWLEYVPDKRVESFRFYPDVQNGSVSVDLCVNGVGNYQIKAYFDGKEVGCSCGEIAYQKEIILHLSEKKLWELGEGNLYDVEIIFEEDKVASYFGLREVEYRGYDFLLNGESVFQRLVLDQGFYPDGLYTAPSIEDMQKDIALGLALGFNGARLHQKVFDPIFLYLCDKAGYMVWGEFASWGIDYTNLDSYGQFIAEWGEVLKRDFNHPSIITWCPLNEVWEPLDGSKKKNEFAFIDGVYEFTKAYDSTRPCVDVSGGYHGKQTDLYDFHCYGDADTLITYLNELEESNILEVPLLLADYGGERYQEGQPTNLSEYGGIALAPNAQNASSVTEGAVESEESWGYGNGESDGNKFVERYRELTEPLFSYKKLSGFCYTQLYDIEQEQNGFYNYDRTDKLTEEQKAEIKKINEKNEE